MSNDEIWSGVGSFAGGFVKELFGGRTKVLVRKKLGSLVFWQDGIRSHVLRIADGIGDNTDLDEIARILRTTQDDTSVAYTWLHANRGRIVKALGPDTAQKVDSVAYRKMGPDAVRAQLAQMVADRDLSTERARGVLGQIDRFNALLEEVN